MILIVKAKLKMLMLKMECEGVVRERQGKNGDPFIVLYDNNAFSGATKTKGLCSIVLVSCLPFLLYSFPRESKRKRE